MSLEQYINCICIGTALTAYRHSVVVSIVVTVPAVNEVCLLQSVPLIQFTATIMEVSWYFCTSFVSILMTEHGRKVYLYQHYIL